MSFKISYDTQPTKFLRKIDNVLAGRIVDKIERTLSNNPVPHDVKPIVGKHGVFRIRIGDYRALYRISHENKMIVVFELDKRSRIY